MKKILFMLLLVFCAFFLFAQEAESAEAEELSDIEETSDHLYDADDAQITNKTPVMRNNIYFGIGPEINSYTRRGVALGATLLIGYEFELHIDTGIRTSYFNDFKTLNVLEIQPFFRYYIPVLEGLYAEADAGIMLAFENKKLFPAFAGGISAGYRLNFKNYFFDFGARFGYPHIWGVNVIAGIKVPLSGGKKEQAAPQDEYDYMELFEYIEEQFDELGEDDDE